MFRRLLPFILLLVGIGAVAALIKTRPQPEAVEIAEKVWAVETLAAQPQRQSPTLTLYARIESPRAATLRAALNADVVAVPVREGLAVDRGDVLVTLDARDAQSQLEQRSAEVAEIRAEIDTEDRRLATDRAALAHELTLAGLAERAVERAQRLAKRDLGSAAVLDEARQQRAMQALSVENRRFSIAGYESRIAAWNARMARAVALESAARRDVERSTIRAPFAAQITAVNVAIGDRVRVGDALLELFDPTALELRAQVPTIHVAALRASLAAGTPVTALARLRSSAADTELVRVQLDRVGARISAGRAGADALFHFTDDDQNRPMLELGRTVKLLVSLVPLEDVVALPAQALYGVNTVFVLRDSRMHPITVERIGEQIDAQGIHRLLVRSEQLTAGMPIIVTQLPSAVEGLKVSVIR